MVRPAQELDRETRLQQAIAAAQEAGVDERVQKDLQEGFKNLRTMKGLAAPAVRRMLVDQGFVNKIEVFIVALTNATKKTKGEPV